MIAWLHHRDTALDAWIRLSVGVSLISAQIALALLTSEIHAYWALREGLRAGSWSRSPGSLRHALIVIGLQKRYARPLLRDGRVRATIFKVFTLDRRTCSASTACPASSDWASCSWHVLYTRAKA